MNENLKSAGKALLIIGAILVGLVLFLLAGDVLFPGASIALILLAGAQILIIACGVWLGLSFAGLTRQRPAPDREVSAPPPASPAPKFRNSTFRNRKFNQP